MTVAALLRWRACAIAAGLALLCASTGLAAGSLVTFGADADARARGGGQTARPGTFAAVHDNPAALVDVKRPRLMIGTQLALPTVGLTLDTPAEPGSTFEPVLPAATQGTHLAWILPFTGALSGRLSIGFVGTFPGFVLTHMRNHDPVTPYVYIYDTYTDHFDGALSAGLSVFPWWSLGVGVRIGAGQKGTATARIDLLRREIVEQSMDAWQYTIVSPILSTRLGAFRWRGLSAQLGLAYRGKLSTPMQVPVIVGLEGFDTEVFTPVLGEANFSPRTVTGGLSVSVDPRLLLESTSLSEALSWWGELSVDVDGGYAFWSDAPSPHLGLSTSVRGEGVEALGLEDALDTPETNRDRWSRPGFVDTGLLRLGFEQRLFADTLALRGGYAYRPSPVPDQSSGTNLADANTHLITAGLGTRFLARPILDGELGLDVAWQSHIFEPRRAEKARADDPVGSWTLDGGVHAMTLQLSYVF